MYDWIKVQFTNLNVFSLNIAFYFEMACFLMFFIFKCTSSKAHQMLSEGEIERRGLTVKEHKKTFYDEEALPYPDGGSWYTII